MRHRSRFGARRAPNRLVRAPDVARRPPRPRRARRHGAPRRARGRADPRGGLPRRQPRRVARLGRPPRPQPAAPALGRRGVRPRLLRAQRLRADDAHRARRGALAGALLPASPAAPLRAGVGGHPLRGRRAVVRPARGGPGRELVAQRPPGGRQPVAAAARRDARLRHRRLRGDERALVAALGGPLLAVPARLPPDRQAHARDAVGRRGRRVRGARPERRSRLSALHARVPARLAHGLRDRPAPGARRAARSADRWSTAP